MKRIDIKAWMKKYLLVLVACFLLLVMIGIVVAVTDPFHITDHGRELQKHFEDFSCKEYEQKEIAKDPSITKCNCVWKEQHSYPIVYCE